MATNCLNHKWQCKTKQQWTPKFYQILIDTANGKALYMIDQQSETSFLFLRTDQGYRNNFLKRYYYCTVIYFSNKHAYRCLTIWIVFIINGSSSKLTNHCNRCFYIRERGEITRWPYKHTKVFTWVSNKIYFSIFAKV